MRDIVLPGGFVALVDDSDACLVSGLRWRTTARTRAVLYARAWAPVVLGTRRTVFMHQIVMGCVHVDHRNGNGLDNRRANLRPCTALQNAQNAAKRRQATSHFRGVSWNAQRGKWKASVTFAGKRHFLGWFASELDAASACDFKHREAAGAWYSRPNLLAA